MNKISDKKNGLKTCHIQMPSQRVSLAKFDLTQLNCKGDRLAPQSDLTEGLSPVAQESALCQLEQALLGLQEAQQDKWEPSGL